MSAADHFFDTNVLLYLLSSDAIKAGRAEEALASGGILSVQVLNEFSSVAMRKIKMTVGEIREVIAAIRVACKIVPITEATHDKGMEIVAQYGLSVYDAMIVASALSSGCKILLTEDMQDGQIFEGCLKIHNPFR
ncbi:PIN domain-containing protein [Propionivibrio sp.]|uniref:PIN domain-containing protein n=1 Tax=Propionivibrio sp. TaxID=2212460 RepID=UPI003BEFBB79